MTPYYTIVRLTLEVSVSVYKIILSAFSENVPANWHLVVFFNYKRTTAIQFKAYFNTYFYYVSKI